MMTDDIFSPQNTSLALNEDRKDLCKLVLDNAHTGVFICDPEGVIRYMNQMFADMFEIDRHVAIGRKVTDYFANSVLLQVMKTGKPHKGIKFSWKGRDALVYRTPIKKEGKVIWGVVEVIFRDIAELKAIMRKMSLLEQKVDYYKRMTKGMHASKYSLQDIIGKADCIQAMKQKAKKFAKSSQPVLIFGESGTGKELLAHAIHFASPRSREVFVKC